MLSKAKSLKGFSLNGLDGVIGKVKQFYFDDKHWAIRYLIAETGDWLTSRQVLISPYALESVNKKEKYISVDLTKKKIEESPSIDSDKPVSQQFETDYYRYYRWPMYWDGPNMWGFSPFIVRDREKQKELLEKEKIWDSHLRSSLEVSGYAIQGKDGEIGHVDDFIIDDETWAIRYLVVDTHNWISGKKVLISPHWIDRVSWNESKVFLKLSREAVRLSPEYSEAALLTRDYESGLHKHYDSAGYWIKEQLAKKTLHEAITSSE